MTVAEDNDVKALHRMPDGAFSAVETAIPAEWGRDVGFQFCSIMLVLYGH